MKVSNLPKDPGCAGWNAILPAQTRYPELDATQSCDNLIIGAGFAGLSAARRIQQLAPRDKTIIVEARRIAQGPAGRNSGFMLDLPHDLTSHDYGANQTQAHSKRCLDEIKLNRAGIDFAAQTANEYAMSDEAFARSGKINAAASAKGIQQNIAYAERLEALNEPHEFLDETQMHALTGSRYYRGGLFSPGAAMIQPAIFVRNMAHGLSEYTSIYENSAITSLERQGDAWLAKTAKASVSAKSVFLAVNGHLESFGFYKRRLMHIFTYASMSRALSSKEVHALGGETQWACLPAHPMGTTIRRITGTGGGRIIVRNRFSYKPKMQAPDNWLKYVSRNHRKSFDARFPALKNIEMEYQWGGCLCLSKNNVAAFGELKPRLFSACCQNGLGTAKGTASGVLAAELAYGHQSKMLSIMLEQEKPEKLPPELFAKIGANMLIRWGEFMAGDEM